MVLEIDKNRWLKVVWVSTSIDFHRLLLIIIDFYSLWNLSDCLAVCCPAGLSRQLLAPRQLFPLLWNRHKSRTNTSHVIKFTTIFELPWTANFFPRCYMLKTFKFVLSNCCVLERFTCQILKAPPQIASIEAELSNFDM